MCAPPNTFLVLFSVFGHSATAVKFLAAGDGLRFFWQRKQWESADDGLALNRLALARNGGGLGVYV